MEDEKVITEEEFLAKDDLANEVVTDVAELSELQIMLVNFAGELMQPEDGRVTTEVVLKAIGKSWPGLILLLAEKNYFAGYKQALEDMSAVESQDRESVDRTNAAMRMTQAKDYDVDFKDE